MAGSTPSMRAVTVLLLASTNAVDYLQGNPRAAARAKAVALVDAIGGASALPDPDVLHTTALDWAAIDEGLLPATRERDDEQRRSRASIIAANAKSLLDNAHQVSDFLMLELGLRTRPATSFGASGSLQANQHWQHNECPGAAVTSTSRPIPAARPIPADRSKSSLIGLLRRPDTHHTAQGMKYRGRIPDRHAASPTGTRLVTLRA